jgi:outer membrane receptor protein involved in Fe transport
MKQRDFTKTPVAAAIGAVSLLMAGTGAAPAQAQTSAEPPTQQVTISARKRTERAIDVPLSISVITGGDLQDRGAIRLSDAQVPNVVFVGPENNALPSFSVRGVQSQNRNNIGFDSGIGVYVDGIYMGRSAAFNLETFDIERVEFLRGPQGTLFGKNSIAGAISVTTREPSRRFEGSGSIELGSANLRRISGYVSSPLGTEAVRGSVAVYSGKRDGYMNNLATGTKVGDEDVNSAKLKVLFKPGANLDITVAADYLKDKTVAPSSHIVSGYGFVADSGDLSSNVDLPALANRTVQGVGGTVNYDFGKWPGADLDHQRAQGRHQPHQRHRRRPAEHRGFGQHIEPGPVEPGSPNRDHRQVRTAVRGGRLPVRAEGQGQLEEHLRPGSTGAGVDPFHHGQHLRRHQLQDRRRVRQRRLEPQRQPHLHRRPALHAGEEGSGLPAGGYLPGLPGFFHSAGIRQPEHQQRDAAGQCALAAGP